MKNPIFFVELFGIIFQFSLNLIVLENLWSLFFVHAWAVNDGQSIFVIH